MSKLFPLFDTNKTVCPSGLRGWTQVPLAQAAWVQIPQLSYAPPPFRHESPRASSSACTAERECLRTSVNFVVTLSNLKSILKRTPSLRFQVFASVSLCENDERACEMKVKRARISNLLSNLKRTPDLRFQVFASVFRFENDERAYEMKVKRARISNLMSNLKRTPDAVFFAEMDPLEIVCCIILRYKRSV